MELREQTIRSNVKRVYDIQYRLSKTSSDAERRAEFLTTLYKPPEYKRKTTSQADVLEEPPAKVSRFDNFMEAALRKTNADLAKENAELILKVENLNEEKQRLLREHAEKTESINQEIERLTKENTHLNNSLSATKQRLSHVYKMVGKVGKPKYLMQTINRKNLYITRWRKEATKWKREAKKAQTCRTRLKRTSTKLKSLQQQKCNRKSRGKKTHTAKSNVDTKLLTQTLTDSMSIVADQKQELKYVENKLLETKEENQELKCATVIPTRDPQNKSRIHPSIKETSMLLQSIGVAENEVGSAIDSVISTLTPAVFDGKLPSKSSQQRVSSEMKVVAKEHLKDVLEGEENLTLKYDGTTKNGCHIVEVEIETKDNTYFIGGRETVGGTAKDYVDCITSVLNEVNPNMLQTVSNTMTDRVITNAAIDRGLEKVKGGPINSFRCAMHPLDSIHKQCDKFIRGHENTIDFDPHRKYPYQKSGESKTQATLRAVDKLFHNSGCGLPKELPQFLKSKGIKGGNNHSLYPRWVGNRFNIYFVNAGLLYMYDGLIREFQSKVMKPRNELHHAVFNMLSQGKLQLIWRALGLVNKFLTGPWMQWQGTRQSILQTSKVFSNVLDVLDNVSARDLVLGFETTAFGTAPKVDEKYISLTTSTDQDKETTNVLGSLLHEAGCVMRRQLEDHLPGGKYHNPSEQIKQQAESCSSNNISGERNFAKIDSRIQKARSATLDKSMSKSQFTINKVPTYLKSKSKEERAALIKKATALSRTYRIKEANRRQSIQKDIRQKLENSRLELEKKEENGRKSKEVIIDVLKYGIWKSVQEVDDGVVNLKKREAIDVLKAQIRFKLDILGCKHPEEKKIAYSKAKQDDLQIYLKQLMSANIPDNKMEIVSIIDDP